MFKVKNAILLFLVLHFISTYSFSQSTLNNILKQELYTSSRSIINGTPYINSNLYEGHPFCGSAQWKNGSVWFGGKFYTNLKINYNILEDELILFDNIKGNEKYIKLNKELVEKFSFERTDKRTQQFVQTELILGSEKRIYELAFSGKTSFYIAHKKSTKKQISNGYLGKLYVNNVFYISNSKGIFVFRNKSGLLKILGKNKELKTFIRKENLRINKKHPNDVVALLEYYNSLNLTT